jgi:hypothetical protein
MNYMKVSQLLCIRFHSLILAQQPRTVILYRKIMGFWICTMPLRIVLVWDPSTVVNSIEQVALASCTVLRMEQVAQASCTVLRMEIASRTVLGVEQVALRSLVNCTQGPTEIWLLLLTQPLRKTHIYRLWERCGAAALDAREAAVVGA